LPDYIDFTEGQNALLTSGLPSTCYFLLSSTPAGSLTAGATLAGGVGEISGTGYARQSQARPTPSGGAAAFAQMQWATGSATNWPSSVCSVVLVTSSDNSGHAICAWNLLAGGSARNLSQPNTTEQVAPTLQLS
jgi:hypothetical protein